MTLLMQTHTATIQRASQSSSASMSNAKTYTTAARGSLPTSSAGRLVPLNARELSEYAMRSLETTHNWYTQTNPQVDERDRLVYDNRNLYVTGVRNPDELGRYWIVSLFEKSSGPK